MHSVAKMLLSATVLLASIGQASAASTRALERAAKKACLAGDPAKGVEMLAELYVQTNDITWIFNQGRCFEQNRRYEDAIGRFREYLVKGNKTLSAADKDDAQNHIDLCQSYLPKPELPKPEQRPAEVPKPAPNPPMVRGPEPSLTQVPTVEQASGSGTPPGRGLRIAGITVAAVGVASLAAAVILNVKANSLADDLNQPTGYDRDKVSERSDYATASWVGYAVGSACVVGGAILYYLGYRSGSSPPVALGPTVGPGQAGVNLYGAF
jgi:hypothetical protein